MTNNIRANVRAMLAAHGVKPAMLDMGTNATVQIFRTWLLDHASEHRGNAETADTVTLRSLELIFADEVEQLARTLRPERVDICKDPTTSEILRPNPTIPEKRNHV